MVYRKFNAPNVEYNEIDRSQYGSINDNAAVGTMTFIAGFADKGDDYDAKYSRSFSDFISTYGYPTNEAERYFYNAVKEVYAKGARAITSKIPYENESKDKFAYTVYASDGEEKPIEMESAIDDADSAPSIFGDIASLDDSITSYFEIRSVEKDDLSSYLSGFSSADRSGLMTIEQYDSLLIGSRRPVKNSLYIVDIARNRYSKDPNLDDLKIYQTQNYLGYLPVLVSPLNALYFQSLVSVDTSVITGNGNVYNVVKTLQTIPNTGYISVDTLTADAENSVERINQVDFDSLLSNFSIPVEASEIDSETVSKMAASFFPSIRFYSENRLDKEYLKQIGIVVFRMYADPSNENKVSFTPVESYIGSLDRKAKDPITNKNLFIDDIVNEQSQVINVFSNFDFEEKHTVVYRDGETIPAMVSSPLSRASTILVSNQTATSLGFFLSQCVKRISPGSMEKSLDMILDNVKDPNKVPIDIVCDAGVSNIAQYMASIPNAMFYEPEFDLNGDFSLNSATSTTEWRKILKKYDDFAKYVRKDCIFVADGLRSLCISGNEKIVRKSAPKNTISRSLVPKIRYMLPPNSSYSAGYCNWFKCVDDASRSYFWCPPSIKAVGVYLYTDRYANVWSAPAGDNRGKVEGAYDIAFNPTIEEAQSFYDQQWNYAISYPLAGIVLEGQKTFQTDKTALDRVNVRRLCNGIKKGIREIARWFKYEGITQQLLANFRDRLNEFLQKVKLNDGISEYYVKVDDENNTPETADRNELHASIAIRPVKTAEFIIINSIVVNQSADLEEVMQSVLA